MGELTELKQKDEKILLAEAHVEIWLFANQDWRE